MRLGNVSRELTCCVASERAALVSLLCLILCSHAEGSSCERYLIRRDSPMHCVRDSEHPDCTMSQLSPSDPCDDSAFVTFAPVELYWQSKQEFLQSIRNFQKLCNVWSRHLQMIADDCRRNSDDRRSSEPPACRHFQTCCRHL